MSKTAELFNECVAACGMVVRDCRQDRRHLEGTRHDPERVCPTGGTVGSRSVPMGRRYSQFHVGDTGQDFGSAGSANDKGVSSCCLWIKTATSCAICNRARGRWCFGKDKENGANGRNGRMWLIDSWLGWGEGLEL